MARHVTATRLCGVAIIIFMGNNILHDRTLVRARGMLLGLQNIHELVV